MRLLKLSGSISFVCIAGLFFSCGSTNEDKNETEQQIDNPKVNTHVQVESGVPLPVELETIHPDSIQPPEIIKAKSPVFEEAHQNIKRVDQPRLALLAPSIPTYTIGQESVLEPEVYPAEGMDMRGGYNEPVTSSKFDFNDAASYNIQGIDVDQGLSSSYVLDMIEDKRGNLWFATWTAGVTMYNGRSFIMFDENKGMRSNYIWCIYEDKDGNIWFGSDGFGASVYDGHSFTVYDQGTALETLVIYEIDGDEDGNIWFATNDGIVMYDGHSFLKYGRNQGLSGTNVLSICAGANNTVWAAIDGKGINKFDGESFMHYSETEGLVSNDVTRVYEDSEENLWIGTRDSGICMYDGYSFITYQEEMGMPANHIRSILEDKHGNMWFGTSGGGACMFNRFEFKHFSSSEGMSNEFVVSLLEDSDGNIWFGTFGAGANVYNERSFENYTEHQGLNDHIIRYIIQDYEDNLWFASNNGVSRYNGRYFGHFTEENGLAMNVVRTMVLDQNGEFWFGTAGNGISRFDGVNFYNYTTENGLSGDFILSMFEDSEGNIWIGTLLNGVTKFDGNRFYHLTEDNGLANNTVHSITEDSTGNIYFGTKLGGLDIFDGETITHITEKEGLADEAVISLYEASDGSIWVGTEGNGLSHLINDTIINYRLEGSNSHNIIWSIIEDQNGDLWLGTERGLNNFSLSEDSEEPEITNYNKQDGLKGSDFYPSSVCLDAQNRIWWGTGKALAMLNLNKYEQNKSAPTIQITDVRLEQTFVDFRKLKDTLEKGYDFYIDEARSINLKKVKYNEVTAFTNCPEQLELPYYLNHITFYFSGIDWSAPHKVRYQYKLQGLDEDWRPVTDENWAVYSNTPSGEYIFKVRAIGDSGIWSDVMSYPVIIHPPWWTTWWAYIMYFLVAGLSLYLYIRYRTEKLLQNKRQLEDEVSKRTAEVVHQKELVERKNQEITDSINYAQRIQTAILPSKNLIERHFNDAFFLYRPKDIVAGDFYWLEEMEGRVLLAAADCTGHGVPGAMVSVVCHNALNRAVREFKLTSPADILNKVRELIIEKFTTADTEMKDGMDISLLSMDLNTYEITYAGANNNLYLISDGQFTEINADKMPVGRFIVNKDFSEHKLKLKKGDCLYIFTDGFADQFGGPQGKKFKYSKFKSMFVDLHKLPMEKQQKEMTSILMDWMGQYEQIDDICIIGVRLQ